jgi:ABC-type sugar transport system ATPase subunit
MVGENGAGKSTLMHIVAGVYQPDKGQMEIDGNPYAPQDEKSAQQAGVAMVFQEGSLFPPLSVTENIFAGRQPVTSLGLVDFGPMRRHTRELLRDLEVDLDPSTLVAQLSPSQRQLVEIAKALSHQVRLLILDEPTSSLTISEARHLFKVLRRLAERGVAIVYVTHRLAEVFEVAHRVTVLKDGRITGVRKIGETTPSELIQLELAVSSRSSPTRPVPEVAPLSSRLRIWWCASDSGLSEGAGRGDRLPGRVGRRWTDGTVRGGLWDPQSSFRLDSCQWLRDRSPPSVGCHAGRNCDGA